MHSLETAGFLILGLTALTTYLAFQDRQRFEAMLLRVADLKAGQYYRLFTSGFIHVDWTHFFFNMFSLYIFAGSLEDSLGMLNFVLVYFSSMAAGSLLAWFYHQNNSEYRAVGASGAVSGIIFSAIVMEPGMELSMFFMPFFFPAWIYGLGFILYSIYGIGKQHDNIGHEAHLGGALAGLLLTLLLEPQVMQTNTMTIIYLAVPSLVFLIILFFRPQLLQWNTGGPGQSMTIDDRYRARRADQEEELNRILDKVKHSGPETLTDQERQFLRDHY